jgi:hypothetical protein
MRLHHLPAMKISADCRQCHAAGAINSACCGRALAA